MISKETQLKNFLVEALNLNPERIHRHNGETPVHLRFKSGNGIEDFNELINCLDRVNLPYRNAEYKHFSRSPDYADQGLFVNFEGREIGLQFNVQKGSRIARKSLNPKSLGLDGFSTTDAEYLLDKVRDSVKDLPQCDILISMMHNLKDKSPIVGMDKIEPQDLNRITSDFGEILAAYSAVLRGKEIYFPIASNENLADYYENGQPVSAKGRNTGGKVNISKFRDLIDTDTLAGKFLNAIADHNKNDFLYYACQLSKEVSEITNLIGGTTTDDVEDFVAKTSYDEFYNYVRNNIDFKGLGIPAEGRPRELWSQGSTDPIYFTINTLVSRFWGEQAVEEITSLVQSFLQKPKFIAVDIVDHNVLTTEIQFKDVHQWKLKYWSRATKAWHNWIAVEPVKGMRK